MRFVDIIEKKREGCGPVMEKKENNAPVHGGGTIRRAVKYVIWIALILLLTNPGLIPFLPASARATLTGAASHFALGSSPRLDILLLCIVFTLGWAQVAARIANRASTLLLNRMTGAVLTVLGAVLIVINYS